MPSYQLCHLKFSPLQYPKRARTYLDTVNKAISSSLQYGQEIVIGRTTRDVSKFDLRLPPASNAAPMSRSLDDAFTSISVPSSKKAIGVAGPPCGRKEGRHQLT